MYNPKKLIYKYNNLNKRVQYQFYIFVGSTLSDKIKIIINKFKDLNLYDTFTKIGLDDVKELENYFDMGKKWYRHFFPNEHIKNTINIIKKSTTKQRELINKFGNEWFNFLMNKSVKSKKMYSYSFLYKSEAETNLREKKTEIIKNDYLIDQIGGEEEESVNIMDIQNIFDEAANIDTDFNKTNKIVNEIISQNRNKKEIKKENELLKFNTEKNNILYDDSLKNLFKKNYIFKHHALFN